jgi:hypothetical protein
MRGAERVAVLPSFLGDPSAAYGEHRARLNCCLGHRSKSSAGFTIKLDVNSQGNTGYCCWVIAMVDENASDLGGPSGGGAAPLPFFSGFEESRRHTRRDPNRKSEGDRLLDYSTSATPWLRRDPHRADANDHACQRGRLGSGAKGCSLTPIRRRSHLSRARFGTARCRWRHE